MTTRSNSVSPCWPRHQPFAMAMDLSPGHVDALAAKAQGLVGEQADGYLGVVSNSSQAADIAAQINTARRAEYQKVANSSGASLADVEAMAGKEGDGRTPAGRYVQVGGKWVKK